MGEELVGTDVVVGVGSDLVGAVVVGAVALSGVIWVAMAAHRLRIVLTGRADIFQNNEYGSLIISWEPP